MSRVDIFGYLKNPVKSIKQAYYTNKRVNGKFWYLRIYFDASCKATDIGTLEIEDYLKIFVYQLHLTPCIWVARKANCLSPKL